MADVSKSTSSLFALALRRHQEGQLSEAGHLYRQVLEVAPNHADALHGLGIIARRSGRTAEAIELLQQAVCLQPGVAEYHTNIGNALHDAGRFAEAADAHRTAIALKPHLTQAHNNLGNALWAAGHREEAIIAIQSALALHPNSAESLTNLGNGLRDMGRSDEALAAQRAAVGLRSDIAELHMNLGNTLALRGELDEAVVCYRRAIALRPESASLHSQLLLTLPYQPSCTPELLNEELARWNHLHAEPLRHRIRPHSNDRTPGRRLRVGYVSSFFCSHVCATFLGPLLSHHDAREFEIVCYSGVPRHDAVTAQFKSFAALWRDINGLSDVAVADTMRDDRIDILIDLHLHTADNRLPVFAQKPAPLQVTWLGYPGSTGMRTVDYRITDPYLDPPDKNHALYVEQSVRLDTFWCYGPDGTEPSVNPLPAQSRGYVTFGSLNNFCKINDNVLHSWATILQSVRESRLLILCDHGSHRRRSLNFFADRGIDPARIQFEPRRSRRQYLELYNEIDIALDTFPYAGHTTTLDAIWMGVPVVTLAGRPVVSRGGLSILSNTGVPGLIAEDRDQYIRLSIELAGDLSQMAQLRSTLRSRMAACPTTDARHFTLQLERAYRDMWRQWCVTGSSPAIEI